MAFRYGTPRRAGRLDHSAGRRDLPAIIGRVLKLRTSPSLPTVPGRLQAKVLQPFGARDGRGSPVSKLLGIHDLRIARRAWKIPGGYAACLYFLIEVKKAGETRSFQEPVPKQKSLLRAEHSESAVVSRSAPTDSGKRVSIPRVPVSTIDGLVSGSKSPLHARSFFDVTNFRIHVASGDTDHRHCGDGLCREGGGRAATGGAESPSATPEGPSAESETPETESETPPAESKTPPAVPETPPAESAAATHEGHEHESAHGKIEVALAELSPEDRALAEKQKICPVSGEPLGSMGKPYKVNVEGKDVLLCCQGCEAKIKENPKEYLAKINL